MTNKNIKVAIGMSGGVDSSVSAMLLKEQGYDVVGVFLKFWHDPNACDISRENACCDEKALTDARKVADQIGIPLYVIDAREPFKKAVTDYFIDEYKNLRTPNPCVVCNKKIKFGWFLDFAKKIGCEYVATGHYARIVNTVIPAEAGIQEFDLLRVKGNQTPGSPGTTLKHTAGPEDDKVLFHLLKGFDSSKDQTYFLYQLDQEQLSHIIFPVGGMTKTEVRELANKYNLPTSEKKESQEVCFIPDDYRSFLKRNLGSEYFKKGDIVNLSGRVVGKHEGLINYTIGQRKGVDQSLLITFGQGDKAPLYVVGFDLDRNRVIVGKEGDLYKNEVETSDLHLINPETESIIQAPEYRDLKVKIRYRAEEVGCSISKIQDSRFKILFDEPQRAVTPGQSVVFFNDDEVVGGGIIS